MTTMRALLLSMFALATVGAAGCNEFHYYDVDVKFNGDTTAGGFTGLELTSIQVCIMTVSGADSSSTRLGPNRQGLPLAPGNTALGVVEFATFADSGTLNFKVEAYNSSNTSAACKVGEGTTSIMAGSTTTVTGMLTVTKMGDFANCQ
jgi:hypothetical protein